MTDVLSVYRQHLRDRYRELPSAVQAFHSLQGKHRLTGEVTICGAESWVGKLLRRLMRLPPVSKACPFSFVLRADSLSETWSRLFPSQPMESTVAADHAFLTEQIGVLKLWYKIECRPQALTMYLRRVTIFGWSLPLYLMPKVHAIEHGTGERLHFSVAVHWPGNRRIISYIGYLDLPRVGRAP